MRELTKSQAVLFLLGGVLMVSGVGSFVFMWHQEVACWVFLAGAVLFSVLQAMQVYEGQSFVIRRLKRLMGLAQLAFVLSGILMVDTVNFFLRPLFSNQLVYIQYVYNKWVVLLLIAAILEVYTSHRISSELKKEKC
jgi:hypothetical protein